ncbi:acyltransferase [Methylobacterium sp. Leaf117]|uniref:acyltransferase family protein n=1 Tax=Methylobacterium sp. Leaf117 TaxID=1736260 RepID=UPI000723C5CB|nr:acyltransferase [Methylobacterium sp. Leaf117]KQP88028.1 hypothetical protein ASF57_07305 [Methylobacterium sp. Leaf117]
MIQNIQVLRGLAALLVVIVHCEAIIKSFGNFHYIGIAASTGVDLFFVISGFIMVYTSDRNGPTPLGFFANRVARVAPLYWLLTIAIFAIAVLQPQLLGATKASLSNLVNSLAFWPYLRDDGKVAPLLFLGWTLNYEMMFYAVFALCLFIKDLNLRVLVAIGVLVSMTVLGQAITFENVPALFFTRPVILEFALGMIVARIYAILPHSKRAAVIALCLAIIALPAMLLAAVLSSSMLPIAGIPAAVLVVAALIMDRGGLSLSWRPLVAIGDASYSLYLTHPFVAQVVIKLSNKLQPLSLPLSLLVILVIYAISITLALLVYRTLEIPMTRVARRLLHLSRPKNPAGAL